MAQKGYIFKKKGRWYGRWRQDVIEKDSDGKPRIVRVQHCEKLCECSDRYRRKKDVQPLLDQKLRPLNEGRISAESTLSVREYAETFFLPHADRELRPATAHGYRALWKTYLGARLENNTLRDFRCVDATNLLAEIHRTHNLGRATLSHCKGLLSVIFTHAKRSGVLDAPNPVRDAGIPRSAKSGETHAYSPQEFISMIGALDGVAKTAVALMYLAGLRPAEARGLKWSDYDKKSKTIRVSRSMWRGFITNPKTEESVGSVPVPQVLADILDAVPRTSEYVLTSPAGKLVGRGMWEPRPVDLHNLASRVIRPALAKCATCKKEQHTASGHEYQRIGEWRGFYALRRGCATLASSLDTPLAAKSLLRHSNVQTTAAYYIKSVPDDAVRAAQKIDALLQTTTGDRAN
jgi:integrase